MTKKDGIDIVRFDDGIATQQQQAKLQTIIEKMVAKVGSGNELPILKTESVEQNKKNRQVLINSIYAFFNAAVEELPRIIAVQFYYGHEYEFKLEKHNKTLSEIGQDDLKKFEKFYLNDKVDYFLEHSQFNDNVDSKILESFRNELREIIMPLARQMVTYVQNNPDYFGTEQTDDGTKKWIIDKQLANNQAMPDLTGISNCSYEEFHGMLLGAHKKVPEIKLPDVVLTDPPYFIGLADWDTKTSRSKVKSEFVKYLLSVNNVLADDGMLIIFNTAKNVELLSKIVKELSDDTEEHKGFNYYVADYHEWIKTNPNKKDDKHYTERSEFMMVAYRNTTSGISRFEKLKENYHYGQDNELFESASLTRPFDEMEGKKGKINQTPKPPRMLRKLMQRLTLKDDVILDSFAGSGSISITGYELGRQVYACELSRYTQIKATNRLQKFQHVIGTRALTGEPLIDRTVFDVALADASAVDDYFKRRLNQLPESARADYVNFKLVDILKRYRQTYAVNHSTEGRDALKDAELSTKIIEDYLTEEDRAIMLGFSELWGKSRFKRIFGFSSTSQIQISQKFDPIALNYVLRYRHNYMLNNFDTSWCDFMKRESESLSNNKVKATSAQICSYEHYLLQLLNSLTMYEDYVQELQDRIYHFKFADDSDVSVFEEASQQIYAFYRILGIMVRSLRAIANYFDGLPESDETNKRHKRNRRLFNNDEDIDNLNKQADIAWVMFEESKKNGQKSAIKKANELNWGHFDKFSGDKTMALIMGAKYYEDFMAKKFERGSFFEIPTLTPLNIGKTFNLRKADITNYKFYAIAASIPKTKKGYISWHSVRNEFIRKSFEGEPKKNEEEYLVKTVKELLDDGLSVIDVSKMLMLTQGTINNLRKR